VGAALRRIAIAACAVAFALFAPDGAAYEPAAQPAKPSPVVWEDVVALRDGSFVRGTVTVYERGREVVVVVGGTGEVRRFGWGEVAGVSLGSAVRPEPSSDQPAAGPCSARSTDSGPVAVYLREGGFLSGEILSCEPDRDVAVKLSGLDIVRHVPWVEVAGVGALGSPPPTWPSYHPPPSPPVGAAGRGPLVHVESDSPYLELRRSLGFRRRNSIYEWATGRVCTAPCDDRVGDSVHGFVFDGPGITQSKVFHLGDHPGDVTFRVRTGSASAHVAGYFLAWFSGAFVAPGIAFTATSELGFRPIGIGMLVSGAAVAALGFGLYYGCRTTYQEIDGGR
jgi:hypothetical protein